MTLEQRASIEHACDLASLGHIDLDGHVLLGTNGAGPRGALLLDIRSTNLLASNLHPQPPEA